MKGDSTEVFIETLNSMLVETFRELLRLEERMINKIGQMNISISELHLLDAVGKGDNDFKSISRVADILKITLPSVTAGVKKLEEKGYIEKSKSETDGRFVYVRLTALGRRVNAVHKHFHRQMATEVSNGLDENEKQVLIKSITKLDHFFSKSLS